MKSEKQSEKFPWPHAERGQEDGDDDGGNGGGGCVDLNRYLSLQAPVLLFICSSCHHRGGAGPGLQDKPIIMQHNWSKGEDWLPLLLSSLLIWTVTDVGHGSLELSWTTLFSPGPWTHKTKVSSPCVCVCVCLQQTGLNSRCVLTSQHQLL